MTEGPINQGTVIKAVTKQVGKGIANHVDENGNINGVRSDAAGGLQKLEEIYQAPEPTGNNVNDIVSSLKDVADNNKNLGDTLTDIPFLGPLLIPVGLAWDNTIGVMWENLSDLFTIDDPEERAPFGNYSDTCRNYSDTCNNPQLSCRVRRVNWGYRTCHEIPNPPIFFLIGLKRKSSAARLQGRAFAV